MTRGRPLHVASLSLLLAAALLVGSTATSPLRGAVGGSNVSSFFLRNPHQDSTDQAGEHHHQQQPQQQDQEAADGDRHSPRQLKISNDVCEVVCSTSEKVMEVVEPTKASELKTRECFGEERLNACCLCLEQGFRPTAGSGVKKPVVAGENQPPQPAFLHVCIPTTPRILEGKDIDFLHIMLSSLEEQVLDQAGKGKEFAGVNLMVYNTRPGEHPVFEENRQHFQGHPFISFKEIAAQWEDPTDFEPDNMNNPKDIPGGEVRRQTFDYINMLNECADGGNTKAHPESFVVILEDDFLPCPFAVDEMFRVLEHLAECSTKGYSSISFSKGMNAIAIPTQKIEKFTAYLEEKMTVLPPDLLIYEKWDTATDVHFANDLFTHLGWFSSFEFRRKIQFNSKYKGMRGANEQCYTKRQRYTGARQRTIGAYPLSKALSANSRSGKSDMSGCVNYAKGSFTDGAWRRPEAADKSKSQHSRYDHWMEMAKAELPGVAANNK